MRFKSVSSVLFLVIASMVSTVLFSSPAQAVGVLYTDPGWTFSFDGDEAFYNDPDGYNPDYFALNDPNNNQPGGQSGFPVLVDPTVADPNCDPQTEGSCSTAPWLAKSNQWDGSAPGDPDLNSASYGGSGPGGISGSPPLAPVAPGGVETYTDSGTTYLRMQDVGNPASYGWTDKGAQAGPGAPRQEGNNRKLQFHHPLTHDDPNVDASVLDNGITISFRARIPTTAMGPLDDIFPEGGTTLANTVSWPTDGVGSSIANDGRGTFMITQDGPGGLGQMGFSLLDTNSIDLNVGGDPNAPVLTKTGLVMNNRANPAVSNDVDTNMANENTLNVLEIPDPNADPNNPGPGLNDWHEFWITIQEILPSAAPDPNGNTHEVNVYHDGEVTTPQIFHMVLGAENEFGIGAHLGLGMSSGTRLGGIDVDFFAYSLGVLTPTLSVDADVDDDGDVDGIDFLIIQRTDPSLIPLWEASYPSGLSAVQSAVPEPSSILLMVAASTLWCRYRVRQQL